MSKRRERTPTEWVVQSILLVLMLWFLAKTFIGRRQQLSDERELLEKEQGDNDGEGDERVHDAVDDRDASASVAQDKSKGD